jgi:hypothetical protein
MTNTAVLGYITFGAALGVASAFGMLLAMQWLMQGS